MTKLSLCVLVACVASALAEEDNDGRKELSLTINGRAFANYVYKDPVISRPYFHSIRTPDGVQVTRNHPIKKGDKDDHQTMHPGIWLSFGDISGHDFWRLKAATEHVRFVEKLVPISNTHQSFTVKNRYKSTDGNTTVCSETCRYDIHSIENGILLIATSDFTGAKEFYFGDQEEMGMGTRLATSISVDQKNGGRILDSEGRQNSREVWGKQATWCDYSGSVGGKHVGISIFPSPKNFRKSWWHARDYGFVAANPFGKAAFEKGKKSKTIVDPKTTFRIQFGVFIHDELRDGDLEGNAGAIQNAYDTFVKTIEQR